MTIIFGSDMGFAQWLRRSEQFWTVRRLRETYVQPEK